MNIHNIPLHNYSLRKTNVDALEKLADKNWLYEQRVVLKKSFSTIARSIGTSTQKIQYMLRQHNIDSGDFRGGKVGRVLSEHTKRKIALSLSNPIAATKLMDVDWLKHHYLDKKMTCQEIGALINVTDSTVWIYLKKYGIETRDANVYPRKIILVSKGHKEIIDFLKTFYTGKISINDREVLNGQELDIYLPEAKLAIEFNGVWNHLYRPHETKINLIKGPSYHVNKTIACEKKGIHLIQIWNSSWKSKKDIWKSILKNKLGLSASVIYARKCTVNEISKEECRQFLIENHLQGTSRSKYKFGLYFGKELVAVMTFGAARYNAQVNSEMMRFCIKQNTSVVGAFSKIFSFAITKYPDIIPCVSYADRMYSDGGLYSKNGFDLVKVNRPGYWYVKDGSEILEHRSKYRKSKLSGNVQFTEWEQMQQLGYSKIFDCGTLCFIHK